MLWLTIWLLDIFRLAGRFVDGLALNLSLAITVLDQGPVTLLDGFRGCFLDKGDLALFLKHLVTDFLLDGGELSDVSVVALFQILVGASQHRLFLDGLHRRSLFHAQLSVRLANTLASKVDQASRTEYKPEFCSIFIEYLTQNPGFFKTRGKFFLKTQCLGTFYTLFQNIKKQS